MLNISTEELRKIQLVELELMEEVKRICTLHEIPYMIMAGTLLGAVRHQGFIPWDDDADIAMLRQDYDRFRKVCAEELSESNFYFQDDVLTEGYRWGYGKFRRKDTVFLREHQEHMPYESGITIDIFPMDGVPDSYPLRALMNFRCFLLRKALWSSVGKIAEKNWWKRVMYQMISKCPEERLKKHYHRLIGRCPENSKYVRILLFPCPNRTFGYERRFYEQQKEYLFEGKTFLGIQDAKAYLHFKFGDYLKIPSEEEKKRKQHPVTALKFPGEEKREEHRWQETQ